MRDVTEQCEREDPAEVGQSQQGGHEAAQLQQVPFPCGREIWRRDRGIGKGCCGEKLWQGTYSKKDAQETERKLQKL